jgi:hypothetical protein
MKIPIQINHLTARFDPKITNGFIVDCKEDEVGQYVVLQDENSVDYNMSFEDFNKFYLSNSNLKLGHNLKND